MAFHKDEVLKTLKVLNLGLITGFVVGLAITVLHIADHRLLHYDLYNLMLFDIQRIVTEYYMLFALVALSLVILQRTLKHPLRSEALSPLYSGHSENSVAFAVSITLILYIIITLICYSKFPYILMYFKKSPLAEPLRAIIKSKVHAYAVLSIYFLVSASVFISAFTFIVLKLNLAGFIQKILLAITNSRLTQTVGVLILGTVILYNAAVFGYKEFNKPEGPNVILIVIDTLRADHLGSYGHYRDTSPNIDALARKGVLYENAYAQAPWTLPSMTSMHTSYYPSQIKAQGIKVRVHNSLVTLAEYLKNNFYTTTAVISNLFVSDIFGFSQGFDTFDQTPLLKTRNDLSSHVVTDRALKHIKDNKENKFFLWVHYMDPHSSYIHHPEIGYASDYEGPLGEILYDRYLNNMRSALNEKDIQYVKDLYDEEISYTDMHIGRILNALGEHELQDDTIIIITADHGEEFLERGNLGHGRTLYQELIHVPLIIYVPSKRTIVSKRAKSAVEVRSIAKTILDLCNIQKSHFSGNNLLIVAEEEKKDSFALSHKPFKKNKPAVETIISGNWKLIMKSEIQSYELYNLEDDPKELNNLFESEEDELELLKKDLITKMSTINKLKLVEFGEAQLDQEDIQHLKALGYIQ